MDEELQRPVRLMNFVSEEQLDESKKSRGERVEDGTAQRDRPLFELSLGGSPIHDQRRSLRPIPGHVGSPKPNGPRGKGPIPPPPPPGFQEMS